MNTSAQGSNFERLVFRLIRQKLETGGLGLLPKACQLHHRKGYYSKDRKKEIICDISIEMYLPGLTNWSLLWVWECKDFVNKVPVDDIEEFWAKLQQIAGVNVKGAMVSSHGFQDGAVKFALSKGIALAKYQSHPVPFLILGDAGTSKSTFARHLLTKSPRSTKLDSSSEDDHTDSGLSVLPVIHQTESSDDRDPVEAMRTFLRERINAEVQLSLSYGSFIAQAGIESFYSWDDFLKALLT